MIVEVGVYVHPNKDAPRCQPCQTGSSLQRPLKALGSCPWTLSGLAPAQTGFASPVVRFTPHLLWHVSFHPPLSIHNRHKGCCPSHIRVDAFLANTGGTPVNQTLRMVQESQTLSPNVASLIPPGVSLYPGAALSVRQPGVL